MKMLNDRRGVSPVITTVIIVAVGITIAIAVALWMTGLVGAFMGYEKVEIRSAYATSTETGWTVNISYVNTGSSPAKIDNVFVNSIPYDQWSDKISCDPNVQTSPASAEVGVVHSIKLTIPSGAKAGDITLVSGVTITVKLHSTGGKEYFTSVVLP